MAVVDEDRRPSRLGVRVGGQAADVPAVAHREQRQHRDLRVLGRVQRPEQRLQRHARAEHARVELVPQRLGLEVRRGKLERREVDRLVIGGGLALVAQHLLGDADAPERQRHAHHRPAVEQALDPRLGLAARLGVPVARERLDERLAILQLQRLDLVGPAHVQVDRPLVGRGVGARALERAQQLARADVDDREHVGRGRAQRDARGRVILAPAPG